MRVRVLGQWETAMGNEVKAMRESMIESRLREEAKKHGGMAIKFVSPGFNGVPDRLVLMPCGRMAFIELKAPGKTPRALQLKRKRQLERLGFRVYVVDGVEQIGGVLREIQST